MQIDYCLITAAGLGTRMGPIGQVLPKILWPIFETTLLRLQVEFAKEWGAKKIYLNGHFLSPLVLSYIEENNLPVTFLHEETLLDVGGAIYNMAKQPEVNHQGKLLVLNGDQFLFFPKEKFQEAWELLPTYDAVLFGISVPSGAGYRQTVIQDHELVNITPPLADGPAYQTYSGVSLFNLERIEKLQGIRPFFESIADYHTRKIAFMPLDQYSYWDFGTSDRYANSLFRCLEDGQGEMAHFLDRTKGWDRQKVGSHRYGNVQDVINMGTEEVSNEGKHLAIILVSEEGQHCQIEQDGLYYYRLRAPFGVSKSSSS